MAQGRRIERAVPSATCTACGRRIWADEVARVALRERPGRFGQGPRVEVEKLCWPCCGGRPRGDEESDG